MEHFEEFNAAIHYVSFTSYGNQLEIYLADNSLIGDAQTVFKDFDFLMYAKDDMHATTQFYSLENIDEYDANGVVSNLLELKIPFDLKVYDENDVTTIVQVRYKDSKCFIRSHCDESEQVHYDLVKAALDTGNYEYLTTTVNKIHSSKQAVPFTEFDVTETTSALLKYRLGVK